MNNNPLLTKDINILINQYKLLQKDNNEFDKESNLINQSHFYPTFIGQYYKFICPITFIAYIFLQLLISYTTKECNYIYTFNPIVDLIGIVIITLYTMASIIYILFFCLTHSVLINERDYLRGIYVCSFTINVIAGISTGLFLYDTKTVCIDGFGIITSNYQWAEWLVLAPLLGFMNITVENKINSWSYVDSLKVLNFPMCILFGFFMHFTQNIIILWILFSISSIFMVSHIFIKYYYKSNAVSALKCKFEESELASLKQNRSNSSNLNMKKKNINVENYFILNLSKSRLSWILLLCFPIFPFVYILSYFNVLSKEYFIIGNMLAGCFTKFIFVYVISLEAIILQLQNERRNFEYQEELYDYLYKDITLPIKLLNMSMEIINSDKKIISDPSDSSDTSIMSHFKDHDINTTKYPIINSMTTLVNHIHKSIYKIIKIRQLNSDNVAMNIQLIGIIPLLESAIEDMQSHANKNGIFLQSNGFIQYLFCNYKEMYGFILGDEMYLKHVFMYYLSQAIEMAEKNTEIIIKIKIGMCTKIISSKTIDYKSKNFFIKNNSNKNIRIPPDQTNFDDLSLYKMEHPNNSENIDSVLISLPPQPIIVTIIFKKKEIKEDIISPLIETLADKEIKIDKDIQIFLEGKYGNKYSLFAVQQILQLHQIKVNIYTKKDNYCDFVFEINPYVENN